MLWNQFWNLQIIDIKSLNIKLKLWSWSGIGLLGANLDILVFIVRQFPGLRQVIGVIVLK